MKENEANKNDNVDKIIDKVENEDIIHDLVENYGFGWITFKIFLIPFIFHISEGIHINMYSVLIIPMKEYYSFTPLQEKFIPGMFFLGSMIGSMFLGKLCSLVSRLIVLKINGILFLIGNLLLFAFDNNTNAFLISRFICGISIGFSMPITLNLLTEYSPIKQRSTIFLFSIMGFTIGQVFQLIIILYVMPNYEAIKLKQVYIITFIPSVIYFLTILLFARDSPRSLFNRDEYDEGFEILGEYKGSPLTEDEKNKIKIKLNEKTDNKCRSSPYSELFSNDYFKITILLLIIGLGRGIHYNGVTTTSSLTMKQLGEQNIVKTNNQVIWEEIYMNLIIFPCYIIAGPVSEIKIFGRRYVMIISFTFCLITVCLSFAFSQYFSLLIGLAILFSNLGSGVCSNYFSEVYPTSHRDSAYGFIFCFIRSGSFISNFIFLALNDTYMWLPYYFDILILSIMILCFYLLPIETCGKGLDSMNSISTKESINNNDQSKKCSNSCEDENVPLKSENLTTLNVDNKDDNS